MPVITYRLEPYMLRIFSAHCDRQKNVKSSSLEHCCTPEKHRRLKRAWGLTKMPYYIKACLLRSPYFVTFAALYAHPVFAWSGRIFSHFLISNFIKYCSILPYPCESIFSHIDLLLLTRTTAHAHGLIGQWNWHGYIEFLATTMHAGAAIL